MPDTDATLAEPAAGPDAPEPAAGDAAPTGGRTARTVALVAAGVLGLLVLAYVVAALTQGGTVPRGTTVSGVEIGGLSRDDAAARLESDLAPRYVGPVEVTAGEVATTLDLDGAIALDVDATVAAAADGSAWNPAHLWRVLTGGTPVEPVVHTDAPALTDALQGLAADVRQEPVDGAVAFVDGAVSVTAAVTGTALDVEAARTALVAGVGAEARPVVLPVTTTDPAIDQATVERAVSEFAEPAMSGPVTVAAGGTTVELTPSDLSPYLALSPADGDLVPALDVEGLLAADPARFAALVKAPVDATFEIVDAAPRLVPAVDGTQVDPEELESGLLGALVATGEARTVAAATTPIEAERTTAEAEALGIVEPISEFTTYYPIAAYRINNIGRAAELINGTLLEPGDEFSLNGVVGERTVENGFVEGTIIDGGRFRTDLGGGVSQVATTTFNAAFFAGLEDVEHRPHAFYISRYPAGREATVAWGYIDLRFINDSNHGVFIQTVHTEGSLTVRFWGTKEWDEIRSVSGPRTNVVPYESIVDDDPECVTQDGVRGFDITVTRQFVRDGAVARSEDFFTRYKPAADITCTNPEAH